MNIMRKSSFEKRWLLLFYNACFESIKRLLEILFILLCLGAINHNFWRNTETYRRKWKKMDTESKKLGELKNGQNRECNYD